MTKYLLQGRSIDGTVWAIFRQGVDALNPHVSKISAWTGDKDEATPVDEPTAKDGLVEQRERNNNCHIDAIVGHLRIVEAPDHGPGTFSCHEVLHMTSFLMHAIEVELVDHKSIKQNAQWLDMAQAAVDMLGRLYQAIGEEHLKDAP